MKRQIHAYRGFGTIAVAGHNIKLGRGGIREIEFFVQTQQLIAGGRQPRSARAADAGGAATGSPRAAGSRSAVARELQRSLLSSCARIEHRLQMVADEQTHEVPDDPATAREFCAVLRLRRTSTRSRAR